MRRIAIYAPYGIERASRGAMTSRPQITTIGTVKSPPGSAVAWTKEVDVGVDYGNRIRGARGLGGWYLVADLSDFLDTLFRRPDLCAVPASWSGVEPTRSLR
jgi:hypothetical protein